MVTATITAAVKRRYERAGKYGSILIALVTYFIASKVSDKSVFLYTGGKELSDMPYELVTIPLFMFPPVIIAWVVYRTLRGFILRRFPEEEPLGWRDHKGQ